MCCRVLFFLLTCNTVTIVPGGASKGREHEFFVLCRMKNMQRLSPRDEVLFEKLIVFQLAKKFFAFYDI
jgi:hypothetical protein